MVDCNYIWLECSSEVLLKKSRKKLDYRSHHTTSFSVKMLELKEKEKMIRTS